MNKGVSLNDTLGDVSMVGLGTLVPPVVPMPMDGGAAVLGGIAAVLNKYLNPT